MIPHSDSACGFVSPPNQYHPEAYAVAYVGQASKYFNTIEEGKKFVESIVMESGWKILSAREVNLL